MQKQPYRKMTPVAYFRKFLTETERRYSQIEKEVLIVTWELEHWVEFFIGMVTSH